MRLAFVPQGIRKEFQSDLPSQLAVFREVDLAHPPGAELGAYGVVADSLTNHLHSPVNVYDGKLEE
ncbi:MAG: hypothetical protein Kow0074_22410 [Candidatus Zixiibacteriota bacterium]